MAAPGFRPRTLALLTAAAFAVRAAWLLSDPEPSGTDGYYYIVQVKHLLAEGAVHVPDSSWALPLMAGVAAVVGDPTLGVKLTSALLAALCVPAAYRAAGGGAPGAWLALWAASSPMLTLAAGEFPKNVAAMAPALLTLGGGWPGLLGAGLAAAAHRTGAALVGLGAMGALALMAWRRASSRAWMAAAGAFALAIVGFGVLAELAPGFLHPDDLARLHLQPTPHPPWTYFALRDTSWPLAAELVGAWAAFAVAAARREGHPLLLPLGVCLLPFWADGEIDIGWRLLLLAPLLAAPVIARAATAPPRGWAFAAVLLAPTGFDPAEHPDYAVGREIVARIPRPLPELCIAPPGLSFLYDAETGAEAMAWAPEPELDRAKIGRIAWGVRRGEWTCAFTPLVEPYAYTSEACWEAMLAAADASGDEERLDRLRDPRNPTTVRPDWMLRGR